MLKAKRIERVVQKKKNIIEDHHDDCGNDMSSLQDRGDYDNVDTNLVQPCDFDTDDELLDDQRNHVLRAPSGNSNHSYPINPANVAQPQPLDEHYNPHGPDARAPARQGDCNCKACRQRQRADDMEHTRIIGECRYPYDQPFIPTCPSCQSRKGRYDSGPPSRDGCRWIPGQTHKNLPRRQPHEPRQQAHKEPTSSIPATSGGREMG